MDELSLDLYVRDDGKAILELDAHHLLFGGRLAAHRDQIQDDRFAVHGPGPSGVDRDLLRADRLLLYLGRAVCIEYQEVVGDFFCPTAGRNW